MSAHAATAGHAHGHADHLASENTKFHHFVNLALFMAFVTGAELVAIFLPFATWIVATLIIVLSVVKFFGVIFWFMHLIYDHKLLTLVFLSSLTIAVGTVTALLFLMHPEDALPLPEAMDLAPAAMVRNV